MILVVGIDPGSTGALYAVEVLAPTPFHWTAKAHDYLEMPMADVGKRIKEVDVPAVVRWLRGLPTPPALVAIERVGYMPPQMRQGAGKKSNPMSGFGESVLAARYNKLLGMLETLPLPYEPVVAQAWQRALGVKVSDKTGSQGNRRKKETREERRKRVKAAVRAAVTRLYPDAPMIPPGCRTVQEGLADAFGIALYAAGRLPHRPALPVGPEPEQPPEPEFLAAHPAWLSEGPP